MAAALLAAGLVGEVVAFTAGHAFGSGGTPALGPLPPAGGTALPPPGFVLDRTETLGPDLMHVWRPAA